MVELVFCYRCSPGRLGGADAVVLFGDFPSTRTVRDLPGGGRFYVVSGRFDDPFIVRLVGERARVIDGDVVDVGERVCLAGVGGREPLMNIMRVSELLSEATRCSVVVVASYYPVHGLFDRGRLGVSSGLYELEGLARLARVFVSALYTPGCLESGGTIYVSLGGLERCVARIVVSGGSIGCRVSCEGE